MKRFLRKALIWLARIAAVLIVFLIILYAEEDWRGARDWATCQKELQAKGETLHLRQLASPGKPEDDLSKVPIFAEIYQQPPTRYEGLIRQDTPKPTRLDKISIYLGSDDYDKIPKNASYLKSQAIDLAAWQKFYRTLPQAHLTNPKATPAQDVLQALDQFDPEMKEVEAALSNPNAYWPLNYDRPWDITLGGITSMIRIAQILPLRAAADFDTNQTDLAEKDYLFSFQIERSLSKNCLLINYLVLMGVHAIDNAILWEGLHRHAWNNAQLQEMEAALASTDMLALAAKALRLDRAYSLNTINLTQAWGPDVKVDVAEYDQSVWYFLHIRPAGWWAQDRRAYSLMVQKQINAINPVRGTFSKTLEHPPNHSVLEQAYIPITQAVRYTFEHIGHNIAKAETYRRLARLACGLEEYHIAHGQYPDNLDDLPDLPAHLNQEVLSEEPLRYQRKGDGYLLYSIGWNQKDDGGVIAKDDREGDWVWPSP
jgi:hypothetical protein